MPDQVRLDGKFLWFYKTRLIRKTTLHTRQIWAVLFMSEFYLIQCLLGTVPNYYFHQLLIFQF